MNSFDDGGSFWLPATPEHTVGGRLSFDGERFSLDLDEPLVAFTTTADQDMGVIDPGWITHGLIYGRLREQGEVTLLDASGHNLTGPFGGDERWQSSVALLGGHVSTPTFVGASFSFDSLAAWAEPPSLITWEPGTAAVLDEKTHVLGTSDVGEDKVELVAGWTGVIGDLAIEARRECWFRLRFGSTTFRDILDQWVRPLQDLLIILLGRPVRLTTLSLTGQGEQVLRAVFGGLQVAGEPEATPIDLISWGRETMFTNGELPIGLDQLITGWFRARADLGDAVTLLCSPFYAPFMYSEHRYAATFQSAESIAQSKFAGAEKPKADHKQRVARIVEAAEAGGVPAEDVEWAMRVLRSRNDKTLAQLISELVASTGPLGELVLAKDPGFPGTAASARTRVSHPGGEGITTVQRYWYGEVLLWIVRAHIAVEAGIPAADVHRQIIQRGNFIQAVAKLGDA